MWKIKKKQMNWENWWNDEQEERQEYRKKNADVDDWSLPGEWVAVHNEK